MKIVEFTAENFKKLKVKQSFDGNVITVSGKNGVGKSSVFDALWIALTGKNIPDVPIKTGENEGYVECIIERDDTSNVIVQRRFKGDKVSLIVKTDDGARFSSPQAFLDEMIGSISFDPFEFINMQPAKQRTFLLDLLGINLVEIEAKKRGALDSVNEKTKQVISKESELREFDSVVKVDEVDTKELSEQLAQMNKLKAELTSLQKIRDKKKEEFDTKFQEVNNLVAEIQRLNNMKLQYEQQAEKIQLEFEENQVKILNFEVVTDEAYNEKLKELSEAGDTNKLAALWEKKCNKEEELKSLLQEKATAQKKVNDLAVDRENLIKSAKMPLESLSFGEDGLLFEGLPLTEEQLSTARIIEIGIQISIALNPKLRIMKIKDGSLLDDEMLEHIKGLAISNDYQLFIERVSNDKELGFKIE